MCTTCVVNWPAKMVPETYNIKKESFVNIVSTLVSSTTQDIPFLMSYPIGSFVFGS